MTLKLPELAPDITEAIRFLRIIAPEGDVTFQTFGDDKKGKDRTLCKILHGPIEEKYDELVRLNQAGAGVFFMVSRGNGQGRKSENVTGIRAIFVDLDENGAEKLKKIKDLPSCRPRLAVESSAGKYHAYWLIAGDLPLECFTPLQRHFIAKFGGDPAVLDLPRVLRLPGFYHRKSTPFLSRIVYDNPEAKPLPAARLAEKVRALSACKVTALEKCSHPLNTEFQVEANSKGLPLWVPDALHHIDAQPYKNWLEVGMALHHESRGSEYGLKTFIEWSSTASNFDEIACRTKWESFEDSKETKVTAGTIFHLAKQAGWEGSQDVSGKENLTDAGNGARLIRYFGQDLKYVPEKGWWIIYENGCWRWDNDGRMERYARLATKLMIEEAKLLDDEQRQRLLKHAIATESHFRFNAMIAMAKTEQAAILHQSELDKDPDLLSITTGVLDLKTGKLRPGNREDYITKISNVVLANSHETCPVWLSFLYKITAGDQDLIGYLQRALGYSLTGHTREQCLFFLHGNGSNGKSTFLGVLQSLLGDYCKNVDPDTLMTKYNSGGATPDLARLVGARTAITIETEEGKRLAENRIKQMTGCDTMVVRHLYQEPFELIPQFKIWIAGNHKPVIKGTDHAIWRRIHLLPFNVTIPKNEQDHRLEEKLKAELPGILLWAVEGTKQWRKNGLNPPKKVLAAVADYKNEMDTIGHWLTDCCEFGSEYKTQSSILYQSYSSWCRNNGHHFLSQTRFGTSLKERGFEKTKSGNISWSGICIRFQRGGDA
jgi:putative DNA primase/helicase